MFKAPEHFRTSFPKLESDSTFGCNGLFIIGPLRCIISDKEGWEHVSVSRSDRCPNWKEMCEIKAVFWDDEDVVMQLHPKKSEYVNNHPYALHLWRPKDHVIPQPPKVFV